MFNKKVLSTVNKQWYNAYFICIKNQQYLVNKNDIITMYRDQKMNLSS